MVRNWPRPLLVTAVAVVAAAVLAGGLLLYRALTGPKVYGRDDRSVEVSAGDTFSVRLPENRSTGYRWQFVEPRPDARIVTPAGDAFDADEPVLAGSGGERTLDFRARGAGRTTLRLRYCFQCGTPNEDLRRPETTTLTYDVTVHP